MEVVNDKWLSHVYRTVQLRKDKIETRCNRPVEISFDIIDTSNSPWSMAHVKDVDLGITKSDIYAVCKGIVNHAFIIYDWSDYALEESLETLEEYIFNIYAKEDRQRGQFTNFDTIAIFFIMDKESDFSRKHLATAAQYRYLTADQILDLSGNYAMVKTSLEKYRAMNERYVLNQQEA